MRRRRRRRGVIGGGVVGILLETGRGVHLRRRSLFSILFLFWIFFWGELRLYFFFLELERVVLGAVGTMGERVLAFEVGGRSLQSEREREKERELQSRRKEYESR
jgi:hypothetical protein